MSMLPKDPAMLLSVVNMHLRDDNVNLRQLCQRLDIPEDELTRTLADAGYNYDEASNRFM